MIRARLGALPSGALLAALLAGLSGCGSGHSASGAGSESRSNSGSSSAAGEAAYASEPFTAHQQEIALGARLILSDGCEACHLGAQSRGLGPSFDHFAGHTVTLSDGQRVLVDEHFLREVLRDPRAKPIAGYDPAPMIAALARLHLNLHPKQLDALAAVIEEIGPEPASE